MKLRTANFATVFAATSALITVTGNAQEAPPAVQTRQASSDQIQTVVVTASKRKEDASKVAMSISVMSGEDMTAQHIGDYADMTRSIPNISFSGGGSGGDAGDGPGLSNIEMRGVSSTAGSATVGIYQDDVSMTVANLYSMGSAEPVFFDLDRVEVLRGPQGTLYGASSMGGTIKFITNQPNLKQQETSFYTEASSFKNGQGSYSANAVFNQPIIPGELAVRFGVEGGHQGGYINLVNDTGAVTNYGINWQDNSVMRFALKWAPTKDLSITPSVFYQKMKTGDTDVSYSQVLIGGAPAGIGLPNYETNKLTREPGTDKLLVPSLTVNYSTDFGELVSVSSFFQRKFARQQDGSFVDSVSLGGYIMGNQGLADALTTLPAAVTLNNEVRQFSQEVRMASKAYDPSVSAWTWLAGAYAANLNTDVLENDYVHGVNATFAQFGASPSDPNVLYGALPQGFPNDDSYYGQYHYHDTQQAVFGEANYYFSPTLHATVGMRYMRATENFENNQGLFYQGGSTFSDTTFNGSKSTPKFSLTWEIDPTNTLYASAAEGFRIGGTNYPVPVGLCNLPGPTPTSYNSDSLWSYELGNKSRFLNNRLSFNASVFYVKWKNMQQSIILPCAFDYDVNVGDATTYGAEFELKAKPVSSVLIDLSGGMTHATLDNSDGANAGVVGAVQGATIPGVPKFNMALTAQYSFSISDEILGFVRGASHWTGTSHGGFQNLPNGELNPDFQRPSYNSVDASTGVSRDNWEVSLFVKNLLNNNMVIQRPIVQSELGEVYRIAPRVIGVSLAAKF